MITRNPIDILRMSDFDNIQSCHSPPSRGDKSYYHCAVAEAHGEGAVAYVVKNEDLEEAFPFADGVENITLDDYEGDELFYDDVRGVGDLTPISRLRLRLVRHYESFGAWPVDIAVPEEAVKGMRIPGFRKALMDWARENQTDVVSKVMSQVEKSGGTLDLGKFTAFGGTYEDNTRQKLLIKFLDQERSDVWTSTEGRINIDSSAQDNVSVGPEGDADQLEEDAQRYIEEARLEEFKVSVSAEYDEESAWLDPDIRLRLEWPADEWKSLPNPDLLRYIPDELEGYGEEYAFLSDRHPTIINGFGKIIAHWHCDVSKLYSEQMHSFYSAEDFEAFLDELKEMERGGGTVDVIKHVVEQFMKREGHMEGGAIVRLGHEVQSGDHKMLEWEWHVEEGYDDPFDHIAAETRMWLKYGDIPEEVVKKVFSTREFWLEIRKRMHAPIHESFENKYYVDIEKFIGDFDEDEVEFKLNYAAGSDDPDDTVEIFQQMIEHWDDEDMLYGLFNTVLKEYAAQIADLAPMEDPEMDMNRDENFSESKKVSGQQLFNNWRSFLGS